jgi:hypothetical protein
MVMAKAKKKITKKSAKKTKKKTVLKAKPKAKGQSKAVGKTKVKASAARPARLDAKTTAAFDKKVYKPLPRCLTRDHRKDGGVEIMRVGDDLDVFVVSGVASFVWKQLDGANSMGGILEQVLDLYDVPERQARTDIENFVAKLLKMELIEQV